MAAEVPEEPAEVAEGEPAGRGRGAAREPARKTPTASRAAKRVKGRTIYLPEDLFERIMVQAHRKGRTISEYVTAILERQVPDYRGAVRTEPADDAA